MTGQASPRWALWVRFTVPCENGLIYLARLRIIQTPWFGLYLHDINEPDSDRNPHDHPWTFLSIVLRGGYTERVYDITSGERRSSARPSVRKHRRFSVHRMTRNHAHRIISTEARLKTLILVGPRRAGWGFYTHGTYVPWQHYVDAS